MVVSCLSMGLTDQTQDTTDHDVHHRGNAAQPASDINIRNDSRPHFGITTRSS